MKILPELRKLAKKIIPSAGIILSTWFFDNFISGEWELFYDKLANEELGAFDYIMSYFFNGELPECIRKNGIPKNVKFIEFPEISMFSCEPWGGFGANPLCNFIDRTNSGSGYLYNGGFPYSEGIFEDVNKFIQLSYYSGEAVSSHTALRRYVSFEFCCNDKELSDAIERTETALARHDEFNDEGVRRFIIHDTSDIDYVYNTLTKYNSTLPPNIASTAKWKMLYLRAVIDYELFHNAFRSSERCKQAMRELCTLYYADDTTNPWLHPPVDNFEKIKLVVAG